MKVYTKEEIVELGDDLVRSLEDACWRQDNGKAHLTGPTPHMTRAVQNFKNAVHPTCYACGKEK